MKRARTLIWNLMQFIISQQPNMFNEAFRRIDEIAGILQYTVIFFIPR